MQRERRRGPWLVAALAALGLFPAAAAADEASLYRGPAPRPGPDILYEPPADAPQLENTGAWQAPPILISGATAYRRGEFLYQDYLYDDHGARSGRRDSNDPRSGTDSFSPPNGTYTYPSNSAYAGNAADLVELRVKPLSGATAFRVTMNTLIDPELLGFTIAIGDGPPQPYPRGANVTGPAERFLTVHGRSAELVDAVTKAPLPGPAPSVAVDMERRQIEVRVDDAAWNPGTGTVRLAAGFGLWDRANDRYLIPRQNSSETDPGGAGSMAAPPAFFNVAFRDEPMNYVASGDALVNPSYWRDKQQGNSLAAGDMTPFAASVDFGKLVAGTDDNGGVPRTGPMNRILASHFETKQGIDYSRQCDDTLPETCEGELRGRLQPYSIYVPEKTPASGRYGLTLLLHSLSANYNQFTGTRNQSQLGERGPGSIVITPAARGPDSWYFDAGAADTFEVWADVAARYPLDPDWVAISGYSMGGYGTYKLSTQYPDLFAAGQPVVGPPAFGIWNGVSPPSPGGERSNTFHMLPSLRHVPFLMWVATGDQLVPISGTQRQARGFDDLGYRYIFDVFAPADHFTLAINDQYQPAADWLEQRKVNRDPARVTYVVNPTMDFGDVRTVADHAYWLSGLRLRNEAVTAQSSAAPRGRIDVRSEGFGTGDPPPTGTRATGGALTGGNIPAIPYQEQSKDWGEAPGTPVANRLNISARNIGSVTVHPRRAGVNCNAALEVDSDGPITVTLAGCRRQVRCLPSRARFGPRGLRALRLGKRRRALVRAAGSPTRRGRFAYRYCVNRGGRAAAVFPRRGRSALVMSNARRHSARGVRPGQRVGRARRRGARQVARGVYRAGRYVFRVRRGRVRAVGVANRRLAGNARLLRTYVRRARV